MIQTEWTFLRRFCKASFLAGAGLCVLASCSTNKATGRSQFASLMPVAQEAKVGASEHQNISNQYGFYEDAALNAYVRGIAAKVTKDTERSDVHYQVFILDSPIVNAFALPGGYLYVSRGLLALANNEAELAAVLSHETGHVTARHTAERYSRSMLTSLGAAVLSAAVSAPGLSDAVGVGSNLYLSSYSRGQEAEADSLGLRYMTRGGYDASQMSQFLSSLQAESGLEQQIAGKNDNLVAQYFSTHPATAERVSNSLAEAQKYPKGGAVDGDAYLHAINGLIYGDNAKQGFVRGQNFYHTDLGFTFQIPQGFQLINQSEQIVLQSANGTVILFDIVNGSGDPASYLGQQWMKGEIKNPVESVNVNGLAAATTQFAGTINGKAAKIQLMAIARGPGRFARFQIALPQNLSAAALDDLKRTIYSFRNLSETEKHGIWPNIIRIVKANAGDTVSNLAAKQSLVDHREEWFRVLNGLGSGQGVVPGQSYKLVM